MLRISGKLSMRSSTLPLSSSSRERGFSLLEVLISVIVLSFGVLGMVGLQAAALKSNRDARLQSEALGLARELAEMMRANPSVATQANNPYLGDYQASTIGTAPSSDCLNAGQSCTDAEDIAKAQMTEWLARASEKLPEMRVHVCMDAKPYDDDGLPQWGCDAPATTSEQSISFIKLGWTREDTNREIKRVTDNGARPYIILPVTPGGQL